MNKIARRLATAAATLAVAGGFLAATGGAASAATASTATVAKAGTVSVAQHQERIRFDGHRYYRWDGRHWRIVSFDYAHRHGYNNDRHDRHDDRRDHDRNRHDDRRDHDRNRHNDRDDHRDRH